MRSPSTCVILMLAGVAAHAQSPADGVPDAQRSEGQRAFVQRRLSGPAIPVEVRASSKARDVLSQGPKGTLFGSWGWSAAWSVDALMYVPRLQFRHVASGETFEITAGGPDTGRGLQDALPGDAIDQQGLVKFRPFRFQLAAGDYELVGLESVKGGQTGAGTIPAKDFEPVRFRIEPDSAEYLGRLVVIYQLREPRAEASRPSWEMQQVQAAPAWALTGIHVWWQDALATDIRLAGVGHPTSTRLADSLLSSRPSLFRREVRVEEIDHNGKTVHTVGRPWLW